jgi:hypothetical protein
MTTIWRNGKALKDALRVLREEPTEKEAALLESLRAAIDIYNNLDHHKFPGLDDGEGIRKREQRLAQAMERLETITW